MWEHYRKTFVGMQVVIATVTISVFLLMGHSLLRAAVFFLVMQLGAVIGSVVAARLKALMTRRAVALPLRPVD